MEDVRVIGPIFDGRAAQASREYTRELERKLGDKARDRVVERMGSEFKHDEGKYVSSIHVEIDNEHVYVRDRYEFVYGPWLEGDGSRNVTTRFKGYHTMRKVGSEINSQAESIAEEELRPYLERMN